jgi:hypothetical protein
MLRAVILLLVLANGVYYAWTQGLLLPWGLAPAQQEEPYRVTQQIRPDAVRVLPLDEGRQLDTGPKPPECLQAGPFDDKAAEPVRQVLAGWPSGSWTLEPVTEQGRWIVYMGKYTDADHVSRKKGELRQIGVAFEPLSNPQLEPGLSLGGFATQADANAHMERLATRGVRTAKVLQERPDLRGHRLVLPAVDDALRPRLNDLKPVLAATTLRPCH